MGAPRTSDGVRPPSWRVGIGRSARGSRAARPLASLRSIAPGSAPRAARSARLRLRIVLLRTEMDCYNEIGRERRQYLEAMMHKHYLNI